MKLHKKVIVSLAVEPGHPADLQGRSTRQTKTDWLDADGKSAEKDLAEKDLAEKDLTEFTADLAAAQEVLYASDTNAILVVLQGLDGAGKDGTIKHVMSGVNPQGCDVVSFKQPTPEELNHDFLWRCAKALPGQGRIGIFNRSYYEDVLVTRVHPELLTKQHLPKAETSGDNLWADRYEDINAFERHLSRAGTRIVKLFLHLSKEEQKNRLLARLSDPTKYWKFSPADLAERAYFDDYMRAYEEAITATSTPWAPWYVIPADHKYESRAIVGGILTHVINDLNLQPPTTTPDQLAVLDNARRTLRTI